MAFSLRRQIVQLLPLRRLLPLPLLRFPPPPSVSFAHSSSVYTLSPQPPSSSPHSCVWHPAARFFSSDQQRKEANVVGAESGGQQEIGGAESSTDAEDDGGDDDDEGLHCLTEAQCPLPDFKDPVEEAAYIGYRVAGRIEPGDIGHFKPPKAFAVVQVGSHQFKISPGDCIYTEKLKFADINDKLVLEKVLLLGSKTQTIIGRPYVPKAFVSAAVEEQVLDAKVIIFKKKRRKNYRRTRGHRQELTRLRILDIRGLGERRSAIA